ncbi:MAG: ABC-type polysaccharide/polyol phosphate transport system [Thermodesulfobacteria bacterium]|nr:ABC transporter ATP-binding protein [Thermodesulfobacteriota bacterium]MCU4138622.1 ABC-type polysaccharide/polyol phosphate transport system [Thermodesulfobacteriota bacterium]
MNVIELKNVWLKFRLRRNKRKKLRDLLLNPFSRNHNEEFWALKEISFQVKKGDIVGVIGRNGAGKSTLLRVLAGIFIPDIGEVKVYGKISPLLTLGAGFRPDLTGRDNIYLNGILLGLKEKEIDAKYKAIVEFAELEKFIDIPVRNYSSGMIARLGFSIAVHLEPDILLIDEIFGVGDEAFRKKSQKKMLEFMQKARAIVLVTHNLNFVKEFCNKAIWINEGSIKDIGKPEEVINNYLENIRK